MDLYYHDTTSLNLYAKPMPLATPWANDVVTLAENGTTGEYHATIASPADGYVLFVRAGGSPADTDERIGTASFAVEKLPAAILVTPANKINSGNGGVVVSNVVRVLDDPDKALGLGSMGADYGNSGYVIANLTKVNGTSVSDTSGKLHVRLNATGDNNDKTGYALTSGERTSIATAVWANATRTLSSFGTLVADIWNAATSGMTTAGSIGKKLADWVVGKVTAVQADAIDAAAIKQDARDAIATTVESHLLDEGDSQMLINAIVGAIGNTNIDQSVLIAAIRADLERAGGNLNILITRLSATRAGYLDATISSRLASAGYTAPANADITSIKGTVDNNLDAKVSTRSTFDPSTTPVALDMRQQTPANNTVGGQLDAAGTGGGGGSVNKQDIADAMLLTPSGVADSGSVIDRLADIGGKVGCDNGTGVYAVDHDGGTGDGGDLVTVDGSDSEPDILRYTYYGSGINGLTIYAYLKDDYDNTVRKVLAQSYTGSDGRWIRPMMLDSGIYYIIADAANDGFVAAKSTVEVP